MDNVLNFLKKNLTVQVTQQKRLVRDLTKTEAEIKKIEEAIEQHNMLLHQQKTKKEERHNTPQKPHHRPVKRSWPKPTSSTNKKAE